jgi:hypothetical protein
MGKSKGTTKVGSQPLPKDHFVAQGAVAPKLKAIADKYGYGNSQDQAVGITAIRKANGARLSLKRRGL